MSKINSTEIYALPNKLILLRDVAKLIFFYLQRPYRLVIYGLEIYKVDMRVYQIANGITLTDFQQLKM